MNPEYPSAVFAFGEDRVEIEFLDAAEREAGKGERNLALFGVRVRSGAFGGYSVCTCEPQAFHTFVEQLRELYAFRRDSATLSEMYYGSRVTFSLRKTGLMEVEGKLFDSGMVQHLTFHFDADQSVLPPFLAGLAQYDRFII